MADFNAAEAAARLMALQDAARYDPRNQVPGMGSTANAVAPPNPSVDARHHYGDMSDDAALQSMLGYGTAYGAMMLPPNALTGLAAVGGGLYGGINGIRQMYADKRARELGYQGN